ncbi:DhaK domain [Dillenia turbinata]|uniref:DhaK domain n=1 Tax=Dillenia turbinata TaxID=194707 RepID=A0AAN8WG81_9MAGN
MLPGTEHDSFYELAHLCATPVMELMIAAGKMVPQLQLEHGSAVDRVYTGLFMTSLDMVGFSISIMKSDDEILHHFDASTRAPSWPVVADGELLLFCNHPPTKIPIPLPLSCLSNGEEDNEFMLIENYYKVVKLDAMSKKLERITSLSRLQQLTQQGHLLEVAIEAAANAIINLRDGLDAWDGKVGDGDCGSIMFRAVTAILEDMKK